MAACQPTNLLRMHPAQLWELACQRWRPTSLPISNCLPQSTVGAGLLAKAAYQPTNF